MAKLVRPARQPVAQKFKRYGAVTATSGESTLYMFFAPASDLWKLLAINRREKDKDEGYQRALSNSRVAGIAKYIIAGRTIPTTLTVSLDRGTTFDQAAGEIVIPDKANVGWVIDGQHRLAGAHSAAKSGTDSILAVAAFIGLSETDQINQFVTINKEAKGVPTSLYLDLLGHLNQKSPADEAKERSVDIANALRKDADSSFYERIVVIRGPRAGEISITNFVRKITPLVQKDRGFLGIYYEREQRAIIDNYFKGLQNVFPEEFRKPDVIFFKTSGFGAMMNALPTFFSTCLAQYNAFTVNDVTKAFKKIGDFGFGGWRDMGSGNAVELQLGEDVKRSIEVAFKRGGQDATGTIRL